MNQKALIFISILAATFVSTATFAGDAVAEDAVAEDAVIADPKHYTVEFENERVRIIRIKYGPGEKSVMHTHGPNVAVFLTENLTRMTLPDGTSPEGSAEVGHAQWSDGEEHLPENLSDDPLEVLLVELKD